MPPLLVYPSWTIKFWYGAAALLFLPFALNQVGIMPVLNRTLCWLLILFCLRRIMTLVFQKRPVLVLNDEGIEDLRKRTGVIAWAEVEQAAPKPALWLQNVTVQLRVSEPRGQHLSAGRTPDGRIALGPKPVRAPDGRIALTLVTVGTDASAQQLVAYINQHCQRPRPTSVP